MVDVANVEDLYNNETYVHRVMLTALEVKQWRVLYEELVNEDNVPSAARKRSLVG